jgi:hypothetical protein
MIATIERVMANTPNPVKIESSLNDLIQLRKIIGTVMTKTVHSNEKSNSCELICPIKIMKLAHPPRQETAVAILMEFVQ